ncbi:MAG: hypothetical protein ACSHW2_04415 [Parasphingopyxis sp.]
MRIIALAGAALPALICSQVAGAQIATDEASDIECLAATLIISQNSDALTEAQAMASVMYFIGKVTARGTDYTQPLEQAMRDMTNVTLQETATRCGAELETVGDDMQRRGAQIQAAEEAETQP